MANQSLKVIFFFFGCGGNGGRGRKPSVSSLHVQSKESVGIGRGAGGGFVPQAWPCAAGGPRRGPETAQSRNSLGCFCFSLLIFLPYLNFKMPFDYVILVCFFLLSTVSDLNCFPIQTLTVRVLESEFFFHVFVFNTPPYIAYVGICFDSHFSF